MGAIASRGRGDLWDTAAMAGSLREDLKLQRERAVLAAVPARADDSDPLAELRSLAETAGVSVVGSLVQRRQRPDARTYLGKGKIEELAALVKELEAGVVILEHDLSPQQLRNVEQAVSCKVIDRSELILDIFANRAVTREARLQVEIAQLEYTAPRLRAMWSHLGQVTGGAPMGVGTRGPGEQQLEIDRRLVQQRLQHLKRQLERLQDRSAREVHARSREHFIVGVVGYTNAGKSTLFNALTAGGAYADDRLFATLGTRVERWPLGGGDEAMLADTVGFIRDLPHHLVASFRSTLEQTRAAHLLLLVVDAADPQARRQFAAVDEVLGEIGAGEIPRILVLNKADALRARLGERGAEAEIDRWRAEVEGLETMVIAARAGEGLPALAARVRAEMLGPIREVLAELPLAESRAIDFIESRCEVLDRSYPPEGGTVEMRARLGRRHAEILLERGTAMRIDGQAVGEAIPRLWPAEAAAPPRRIPPHERFAPPHRAAESTAPPSRTAENPVERSNRPTPPLDTLPGGSTLPSRSAEGREAS